MEQGEEIHNLRVAPRGGLGELQPNPGHPDPVARTVQPFLGQLVALQDRSEQVFHNYQGSPLILLEAPNRYFPCLLGEDLDATRHKRYQRSKSPAQMYHAVADFFKRQEGSLGATSRAESSRQFQFAQGVMIV